MEIDMHTRGESQLKMKTEKKVMLLTTWTARGCQQRPLGKTQRTKSLPHSPWKGVALLTLRSGASILQNCETIQFFCLKHLLWFFIMAALADG